MISSVSIVASSLSLLSSSNQKFSVDRYSYQNPNQRCPVVCSGVRMDRATPTPGETGFDFYGASKSFNVLAEYLFGKVNAINEKMEMTTPVVTRKVQSAGKKMEMTTPVITRKAKDQTQWQMSFVMPSKYGSNLPLPKDSSVKIEEVPRKIVAVVAFSGYVTDEEIERREQELRRALQNDKKFRVKDGVSVEAAQYNPPFTLPFTRRNEVSLEVESRED